MDNGRLSTMGIKRVLPQGRNIESLVPRGNQARQRRTQFYLRGKTVLFSFLQDNKKLDKFIDWSSFLSKQFEY